MENWLDNWDELKVNNNTKEDHIEELREEKVFDRKNAIVGLDKLTWEEIHLNRGDEEMQISDRILPSDQVQERENRDEEQWQNLQIGNFLPDDDCTIIELTSSNSSNSNEQGFTFNRDETHFKVKRSYDQKVQTQDLYEYYNIKDPLPKASATRGNNNNNTLFPQCPKHDERYPHPTDEMFEKREFPAPIRPLKLSKDEYAEHFTVNYIEKRRKKLAIDIAPFLAKQKTYMKFIRDKIKENVFVITIPEAEKKLEKLSKGLARSNVLHKELQESLSDIVCYLCEQIAIKPIMCADCKKLYCMDCAGWLRVLPSEAANVEPVKQQNEFICISRVCYAMISSNRKTGSIARHPMYFIKNSRDESKSVIGRAKKIVKFYEEAKVICPRKYCNGECTFNWFNRHHERNCRLGPIDYTIDTGLLGIHDNFKTSAIRKQVLDSYVDLSNLVPSHVKSDIALLSIQTHKSFWKNRYYGYFYLIDEYNKDNSCLTPLSMRNQIGESSNYWSYYKLSKDSNASLSESEEWLLSLGFPPIRPLPTQETPKIQMTKWYSNTIPWYLSQSSVYWWREALKRFGKTGSTITNASSCVLHDINIEDEFTPFVFKNPFELLSTQERLEVERELRIRYPSCALPNMEYAKCKIPSSNETREKVGLRVKRLSWLFAHRPPVLMPELPQDRLNYIQQFSQKTIANRELKFVINCKFVQILEEDEKRGIIKKSRPSWVIIINAKEEVIYETFVKYRREVLADELQLKQSSGLNYDHIKNGKYLHVVRDQVLKFFVCAKTIIGCGLHQIIESLGISESEETIISPKLRELTQVLSPYKSKAMNLHHLAYLWLIGYVLPVNAHSPAVEAITSLRLYTLDYDNIEGVNRERVSNTGIHHKNQVETCGNQVAATLLFLFQKGINEGRYKWPKEWDSNPHIRTRPQYNDECVPVLQAEIDRLNSQPRLEYPHIRKQPTVYEYNNQPTSQAIIVQANTTYYRRQPTDSECSSSISSISSFSYEPSTCTNSNYSVPIPSTSTSSSSGRSASEDHRNCNWKVKKRIHYYDDDRQVKHYKRY